MMTVILSILTQLLYVEQLDFSIKIDKQLQKNDKP